ncbi:MAG: tetratricopeptide repeat protein, partial [Myxococcota bacterium]
PGPRETILPALVAVTPDLVPEVDLSDEDDVSVEPDDGHTSVPLAMQSTGTPPPFREIRVTDDDTEEAEVPDPIPYIEVSDVHVPPEPIPEVGIDTTEDSIVRMRTERRRSTVQWVVTTGLLLLAALIAGAWMLAGPEVVEELEAGFASGSAGEVVATDPRPVGAPAGRSIDLPSRPAPTEEPPTPQATPEPPAPAEVVDEPAPREASPKPRPRRPKVRPLHDEGWQAVEEADFAKALDLFDEAMRIAPRHPEGLYGRGYTLLKLGREDEATETLCQAIAIGNATLQREVRGIMQGQGLACPD